MNTELQAHIALQLLASYIQAHDDEEAKRHYNALVLRLQVLEVERQRQATTTIDDDGNITIGLKPVGVAGTVIATR